MANIDEFISRLQKARKTGKNSWLACCPAHQDKNPSMSVSEGTDGRILVHCFSHECSIEDITSAVGMEVKDLMPENLGYHRIKPLAVSINPRDALFAIRDDMTVMLIMAKMVQRGEALTDVDTLLLAKLIGRMNYTISLTGGE